VCHNAHFWTLLFLLVTPLKNGVQKMPFLFYYNEKKTTWIPDQIRDDHKIRYDTACFAGLTYKKQEIASCLKK